MNTTFKSLLALGAVTLAAQAAAQITFYEAEGFRGRAFTTGQSINDFERLGHLDRIAGRGRGDDGHTELCLSAPPQ